MNIWRINTLKTNNVHLTTEGDEWDKLDRLSFNGHSLADEWDPTFTLFFDDKRSDKEYSDALRFGENFFILNKKALNIFESLASDVIECLDFQYKEDGYIIVHPISIVDCLILEKSEYKVYKGDKNTIQSYKKLCIKKEAVEGRHFFRIAHLHRSIMACSDELKTAIEEAQIQGIGFELISDECI